MLIALNPKPCYSRSLAVQALPLRPTQRCKRNGALTFSSSLRTRSHGCSGPRGFLVDIGADVQGQLDGTGEGDDVDNEMGEFRGHCLLMLWK